MIITIVRKDKFSLVGKEGKGASEKGFEWVPPIWKDVMSNINEVKPIEKLGPKGESLGCWGAMTDINHEYKRWDKEGKYLVGIEVELDAIVPSSWVKWDIPAFEYISVVSSNENYNEVMKEILKIYMPEHNYNLVGAIQEYYSPNNKEGEMYLYFPIKRL